MTPLAKAIMARGLSQKEFAGIVRVKPSSVCKWTTGECLPEAHRIPAMANTLNLSVDRLADVLADTFARHPGQDSR